MRYYNIVETDTSFKISFDVTVDNYQFVGITFEMTGSVNVVDQKLKPVIDSVLIYGFVKDNDGVQYNLNLTLNETEMTLTLAQEGQTPVVIDLSGELNLDLGKRSESDFQPVKTADWETMVVRYGQFEMVVQPANEVVGFIKWQGVQVATLITIEGQGGLYVRWSDGREVLINTYLPQSGSVIPEGGGIV